MTTMTIDAGRSAAGLARDEAAARRPSKRTLFSRLWAALEDAGRKRAEREIEAYIQARGGRQTDSLERDIERFCAERGLR